ncbi:sugar transferase [Marivita sp. S2033]|uniref:sugar transferase n=1 Tax=Marivita sp. S2033 TaxID=3373187 RepID=UPI0039828E3B
MPWYCVLCCGVNYMRVLSKSHIGFQPNNPTFYRTYNFVLAALLLLMVLPLLVMISVALFFTQGREIFYSADRLGKNQKPFRIIKFRTLCSARARELTQNCTLPIGTNIETPLGGMLRETRLDELPQLVNILRGDMNLCGPRPVRAEIAKIERQRIPHYDVRFHVKPGLVGPTQAYFGHGASKRLRARMNNSLVNRPVSIRAELMLLGRIAASMFAKLGRKLGKRMVKASATNTVAAADRQMWLTSESGQLLSIADTINLREVVAPSLSAASGDKTAVLHIRLKSGGVRKARIVLTQTAKAGVFTYFAKNEYGQFIVERYALGLVVVPPQLRKPEHKAEQWGPLEAQVQG